MINTFLWDGQAVRQDAPRRRPIATTVLELPVQQGGVALVNIDRELQLIALRESSAGARKLQARNKSSPKSYCSTQVERGASRQQT